MKPSEPSHKSVASASELALELARRTIEYFGGKRPEPQMDCDLEMWNLANALLKALEASP
jgi:hypothetical protein